MQTRNNKFSFFCRQNFIHNPPPTFQAQPAVPPPPVTPAVVPQLPVAQSTVPAMQSAQGLQPQAAVPVPATAPPQIVQIQVAPLAVAPSQPVPQPRVNPGTGNIVPPDNPILASALYQAMANEGDGANTGLTMDDLHNMMITQGRSVVASRGRTPASGVLGTFWQ